MSEYTPSAECGSIATKLIPLAARRGIHALWQADGSRRYIENTVDTVTQTDVHVVDVKNDITTTRTAYEDAVGAFTNQEACILTDRTDAEEQAADHLLATPDDVPRAADAVTRLFHISLFIAAETASDPFEQQVPDAEIVREEARSMVGGAAIAVKTLDQIANCHPDITQDEVNLPSRNADW